jgi:hypothetical protein
MLVRAVMRLSVLLLFLVAVTTRAQTPFVSPDGRFEGSITPNVEDGVGQKLWVRSNRPSAPSRLILANNRWLEAQWSPDSRFLAVTNHTDGHISVVLVFGIRASASHKIAEPRLYFISPDPGRYDVKWHVVGWDTQQRSIFLHKSVAGNPAPERQRFAIGHTPLVMP